MKFLGLVFLVGGLALACPNSDCGDKKCAHKTSAKHDEPHHGAGAGLSEHDREHAAHQEKFMVKPEGRATKQIPGTKKAAAKKSAAAPNG